MVVVAAQAPPRMAARRTCLSRPLCVVYLTRVVLMGQGGVGKTAMVTKFTSGEFNEAVRGGACGVGWGGGGCG